MDFSGYMIDFEDPSTTYPAKGFSFYITVIYLSTLLTLTLISPIGKLFKMVQQDIIKSKEAPFPINQAIFFNLDGANSTQISSA